MNIEIYLVSQEKRCGLLDNFDFSYIRFVRAFVLKKDAEFYLHQLKQNLINEGYKPYNDSDLTWCHLLRENLVKLTIKKIPLICES